MQSPLSSGAILVASLCLSACAALPPTRGHADVAARVAELRPGSLPDAAASAPTAPFEGTLDLDAAVHEAFRRSPHAQELHARLGVQPRYV